MESCTINGTEDGSNFRSVFKKLKANYSKVFYYRSQKCLILIQYDYNELKRIARLLEESHWNMWHISQGIVLYREYYLFVYHDSVCSNGQI